MKIAFLGNSLTSKILKAMSVFSGVQAIGIICSVIRTKLIALWIGPIGVGLFAVFNSAVEMIVSSTQLPMRESSVRDISASSDKRLSFIAGVVRWWAVNLGLFGALVMVLLSPLLSLISFDDYSHWWAFVCLSAAVFTLSITNGEQALMQGKRQLNQLAKTTVTGAIMGTLVSIPLYYFFGQGSIIPSIMIFAFASTISVFCYRTIKSSHNTSKENIATGKSFLRLGVYLSVSSIVTTAASFLFLSYLTNTESSQVTGIYQAGYTIVVKYTGIIFTAMSMEYFPRLVNVAMKRGMASIVVSHELTIVLAVILPMIIVLMGADRFVLWLLYSEEFIAALPIITIGICGTLFRAISYCMSYIIVSRGDGRMYILCDVLSAMIGLGLNISFYRLWGYAGLGLSYVLWYIAYTVIISIVYYKRYGMHLTSGAIRLSAYAVAITLCALALKMVAWWLPLVALIPSLYITYRVLLRKRRTNKK